MPAFGPAMNDLHRHVRRLSIDRRRIMNGLPPLAPEGALSLVEDNAKGRLSLVERQQDEGPMKTDFEPREADYYEDLADLVGVSHFGVIAYWFYSDTPDWPPTEPRPAMPGLGTLGLIPVGWA